MKRLVVFFLGMIVIVYVIYYCCEGKMADVVKSYSRGDFSVDMDRLPGELAEITAARDHGHLVILD